MGSTETCSLKYPNKRAMPEFQNPSSYFRMKSCHNHRAQTCNEDWSQGPSGMGLQKPRSSCWLVLIVLSNCENTPFFNSLSDGPFNRARWGAQAVVWFLLLHGELVSHKGLAPSLLGRQKNKKKNPTTKQNNEKSRKGVNKVKRTSWWQDSCFSKRDHASVQVKSKSFLAIFSNYANIAQKHNSCRSHNCVRGSVHNSLS